MDDKKTEVSRQAQATAIAPFSYRQKQYRPRFQRASIAERTLLPSRNQRSGKGRQDGETPLAFGQVARGKESLSKRKTSLPRRALRAIWARFALPSGNALPAIWASNAKLPPNPVDFGKSLSKTAWTRPCPFGLLASLCYAQQIRGKQRAGAVHGANVDEFTASMAGGTGLREARRRQSPAAGIHAHARRRDGGNRLARRDAGQSNRHNRACRNLLRTTPYNGARLCRRLHGRRLPRAPSAAEALNAPVLRHRRRVWPQARRQRAWRCAGISGDSTSQYAHIVLSTVSAQLSPLAVKTGNLRARMASSFCLSMAIPSVHIAARLAKNAGTRLSIQFRPAFRRAVAAFGAFRS